jgi:predicted RNase H-like HicB family nuclease
MKKHYPIVIEQDKDGVFIVECPAFEGCRSYGKTMDEALSNIREAIQVCIDEIEEDELGALSTFIGVRDIEVALG